MCKDDQNDSDNDEDIVRYSKFDIPTEFTSYYK